MKDAAHKYADTPHTAHQSTLVYCPQPLNSTRSRALRLTSHERSGAEEPSSPRNQKTQASSRTHHPHGKTCDRSPPQIPTAKIRREPKPHGGHTQTLFPHFSSSRIASGRQQIIKFWWFPAGSIDRRRCFSGSDFEKGMPAMPGDSQKWKRKVDSDRKRQCRCRQLAEQCLDGPRRAQWQKTQEAQK